MDDRRKYPRMRVLKSAKVLVGKTGKVGVPCVIRNVSEGGLCLEFPTTYGLPAVFEIVMPDGPHRNCKVAWLDGVRMGVQFQ